MTIHLILKSDHVARVPDRWAAQYKGYASSWAGSSDKAAIGEALLALKGTDFTAEQVDGIIGNASWTEFKCSECNTDQPVLVRIGEEPDYEARYVDLCPACLAAATKALHSSPAAKSLTTQEEVK